MGAVDRVRTLGPFPPDDIVTMVEAAHILGCSVSSAGVFLAMDSMVASRRYAAPLVSRADVESLATEVYMWRRHRGEVDSYWVTGQTAAMTAGISRAGLAHIADDRRSHLFKLHQDGTRLYRRSQLEALNKARADRLEIIPPS